MNREPPGVVFLGLRAIMCSPYRGFYDEAVSFCDVVKLSVHF